MTTIAESVSSPAPAVAISNKRPLDTKPDAANTDGQKTKQRSVLGGLQGKQLSKMEKLHLADLKAKAAKLAKKPKAEDGEAEKEAEAPKSKPIQRPMSKLDREIAAKKAKDEAKEKAAEREKKKEERAAKAAMPKRPKSGYLLYSNDARPAVKEANPEAEATDMLKLLAQGWKDLSEEEQLKWKAEAETDKERYFAECKEAGVEPELKEAKDEADKHPKKPKGAYFCYAMSERAAVQEANADTSAKDVTKLLGEAWKALGEEDRKQWDVAAEADKERYLNECKEAGVEPELKEAAAPKEKKERAPKKDKAPKKKAREEGEEEEEEAGEEGTAKPAKKKAKAEKAAPTAEEKAAKAEKAAAKKTEKAAAKKAAADENEEEEAAEEAAEAAAAEAPKIKKALSSYILFCAEERPKLVEANPEAKSPEIMSLMGVAWKALGAEGQAKWVAAALADKERYAAECEAAGVVPGGAKPKAEKAPAAAKADPADKAKEDELKAQIESAKAEIAEHDAKSAAMKQPKSHKTALACYKKKQIPVVAGANPDMAVEQIQELMTDNFEKLGAAEKRPYDDEAEADLLRYQTACEEHKAKKDAALKLKADTKRKLDRLEKELKDERARTKEARAAATAANKAATAANKAAKEEKAASKKEKDAEKVAKAEQKVARAEKAAAKKAAKEAKGGKKEAVAEGSEEAAEDMEVEEASGEAADVEAAIEDAVAEEAAEEGGSDAEVEEEEEK